MKIDAQKKLLMNFKVSFLWYLKAIQCEKSNEDKVKSLYRYLDGIISDELGEFTDASDSEKNIEANAILLLAHVLEEE